MRIGILILFPILILACSSESVKTPKKNLENIGVEFIVEKTKNGELIERTYYDKDSLPISLVFFDSKKPIDSIFATRSKSNNSWSLKSFHFEDEAYLENDAPITNMYNVKFPKTNNCKYWDLEGSNILKDECNNICIMSASSLVSGKSVEDLKTIKNEGEVEQITYDNLNSKFIDLSEDIKAYFYMETLSKFEVLISKNKLIEERYFFENGNFNKKYYYDTKNLIVAKCTVTYNDVQKKSSNYELKYLVKSIK